MIPVLAVQGLIETSQVLAVQGLIETSQVSTLGGLSTFLQNIVVSKLLEAIVPGLALKIFLAIVPMILNAMMMAQKVTCVSLRDFGVVTRYFTFQVVVVFVFNVIGGSFFNQVQQWIKDPTSVITVLGTAIPMTATFFITFIWIGALITSPLGFLRIFGLALFWIFDKLSGSPKQQEELWQEQYTWLGPSLPNHVITRHHINPIIAPSCLVYFLVNTFIERYNNIYITRRMYESAGLLWPRVFHQIMFSLYLFQLVMLALLGIKKFPFTVLIIPVPLITLGFHFTVVSLFTQPWKLMSLHDASILDRDEGGYLLEGIPKSDEHKEETPEVKKLKDDLKQVNSELEGEVQRQSRSEGAVDHEDVELGVVGTSNVPTLAQAEAENSRYISPAFAVKEDDLGALMEEAVEMTPKIDAIVAENLAKKDKKKGKYAPTTEEPLAATVLTQRSEGSAAV
eukprot:gene27182-2423_t